ncbi:MAG: hypothetical protein ACC655_07610, partial [Rhodothermia bacterium]
DGLMVPWGDGPKFGLFFGLIWAVRDTRPDFGADIRPVERLTWSWPSFRAGIKRGARVAFPVASLLAVLMAVVGTFATKDPGPIDVSELFSNVAMALVILWGLGLIFVVIFAFFRGVQPGFVREKTHPNQGIRLSVKYSFRVGILLGLAAGVAFASWTAALSSEASNALRTAAQFGPLGGVYFGLIAGAWYGGLDVLRHYVLRIMLGVQGCLPTRLIPFLEYSSGKLHFLQRVGGGYMFVHRYLLLHFAELHGASGEEG